MFQLCPTGRTRCSRPRTRWRKQVSCLTSWRKWLWRGRSGDCCPSDLDLDKKQKTDGWILLSPYLNNYLIRPVSFAMWNICKQHLISTTLGQHVIWTKTPQALPNPWSGLKSTDKYYEVRHFTSENDQTFSSPIRCEACCFSHCLIDVCWISFVFRQLAEEAIFYFTLKFKTNIHLRWLLMFILPIKTPLTTPTQDKEHFLIFFRIKSLSAYDLRWFH